MRRRLVVWLVLRAILAHQQYPPGYRGPGSHVTYQPIPFLQWGRDLLHLVTSPATDAWDLIKDTVLHAIHVAVSGVENLVEQVSAKVSALGGDVFHHIGALWSDFDHLVTWDIPHWFDLARHDTAAAFDTARHDTAAAFDLARHDLAHELDVIRHDVIDPIGHAATDAYRLAHEVAHVLDVTVLDAVHLVEKCWRFLEWVADHPIAALELLPAAVERDFVEPTIAEVEKSAGSIWHDLDKSLSELLPAEYKRAEG